MRIYFERGFQALFYFGFALLLCIPLFLSDTLVYPYATAKTFLFRAVVDALFLCCLLHKLYFSSQHWGDSWIMRSSIILLVFAWISAFYGVAPNFSLYGNLERMDGVIQLTHVFMYFLILAYYFSSEKRWNIWITLSIAVAVVVVMQALISAVIFSMGARLGGRLGNPIMFASYLMFPLFWSIYLSFRSQQKSIRYGLYLIAGFLFYGILRSGSRGVLLGVIVGILVAGFFLIASQEKRIKHLWLKATGFVGLTGLVTFLICYLCFSYWAIVPERQFSWISNHELFVRFKLWGIAWNAIKDAPWLGWGMNNFSYAFDKYYLPSFYGEEAWFDRTHNVLMDWLITGGVFGLLSYLGLLVAVIYSLSSEKGKSIFSRKERALLLGLLAGYLTQNLFAFDTLTSYMAFFTLLAFIHTRIRQPFAIRWFKEFKLYPIVKYGMIAPALCFCFAFYLTRIMGPQFLAARDVMTANKNATNIEFCYGLAQRALEHGHNDFGHQEILEFLFQVTGSIYKQKTLPQNKIDLYVNQTLAKAKTFLSHNSQSARSHYSFATFAIAINNIPLANQELELARRLSPKRQIFIIQQASLAMEQQNFHAARELFKVAYDLDTNYKIPLQYYNALAPLDTGDDKA